MDALIQFGLEFIAGFQSLAPGLVAPMKFFTFLGSENFFLFVLPLTYWCVDAGLGIRIGFILLASNGLGGIFKMALHGPRPHWVGTETQVFDAGADTAGFGIPSGHSLTAFAVWGMAAAYLRKAWAWPLALTIVFLVGVSRIYLGVHFPHDVLTGWALGGLILWAFVKLWDPLAARLKRMTLGGQAAAAFAASMAMILLAALAAFFSRDFAFPGEWSAAAVRAGGAVPDPFSLEGVVSVAGTLFGLGAGLAWIASRGGCQVSGPAWKRALRYVVGVAGVAVFYFGLKLAFPGGDDLAGLLFRYARYMFVGAWITAGAPRLFSKMKL